MAGWMIKLGGVHVVPIVNLLHDHMLEDPLIHCDETRLNAPSIVTPSMCAQAWIAPQQQLGGARLRT
jgi:hypothetical protein